MTFQIYGLNRWNRKFREYLGNLEFMCMETLNNIRGAFLPQNNIHTRSTQNTKNAKPNAEKTRITQKLLSEWAFTLISIKWMCLCSPIKSVLLLIKKHMLLSSEIAHTQTHYAANLHGKKERRRVHFKIKGTLASCRYNFHCLRVYLNQFNLYSLSGTTENVHVVLCVPFNDLCRPILASCARFGDLCV